MKIVLLAKVAGMPVGCAPAPGPYLSCEDVPAADCEAAHEEAITDGLSLGEGEQAMAARVRPAEVRLCNGGDDPFVDVSFTLTGRSTPVVVSVGRTVSGGLVACTY